MGRRLCNLDCFNCKYKDCINSTVTIKDYKLSKDLDKAIIKEITPPYVLRRRKASLSWYYRNREAELIRKKKYREENRDMIREKGRQYHLEHKEQDNQRHLATYYSNHEENKKKRRDSKRARYQANKEYYRQKQREYRHKLKERRLLNEHNKN